jgi:hypothetical protein
MSAFYTYSFTETDVQNNSNVVKEVVVRGLANEGLIDKDKIDEILNKYAVVVVKKGWLGRAIDKIFFKKDEKDAMKLTLVKLV